MKILRNQEVVERLDVEDLCATLETAFKADQERYTMPPRMVLNQGESIFLVMPCYGQATLGMKIVTMVRKPGRGPRVVKANYTLYDAKSGDAILLLEADALTDLRTAATSLLATRAMARPEASVLGIFGTGRLAAAHLPVMLKARNFREVLICGSSEEGSRAFSKSAARNLSIPIRAVDARTCAAESHVLCTCTTSSTPLFDGRLLQPGAHLNLVGAFGRENREVDDETVKRARVVVDTYEGCLRESGDILTPQGNGSVGADHVLADLHEALVGKKLVRRGPHDITLFKSVGCAMEDLVAAHLLFENQQREPG